MSKDNKIEKWLSTRKEKKREFNAEILYKNLIKGDRVSLGRAITLIESTNVQDRFEARKLIKLCLRINPIARE